jgi:hypothetical protein
VQHYRRARRVGLHHRSRHKTVGSQYVDFSVVCFIAMRLLGHVGSFRQRCVRFLSSVDESRGRPEPLIGLRGAPTTAPTICESLRDFLRLFATSRDGHNG